MQNVTWRTYTIPAAGNGQAPPAIAIAATTPIRVVVRNLSAVLVFLGGSGQDVTRPTTETFRLPGGEREIFVLATKQSLFASGSGIGALLSVSVSEALPLELEPVRYGVPASQVEIPGSSATEARVPPAKPPAIAKQLRFAPKMPRPKMPGPK